jgi:hypothetical protein
MNSDDWMILVLPTILKVALTAYQCISDLVKSFPYAKNQSRFACEDINVPLQPEYPPVFPVSDQQAVVIPQQITAYLSTVQTIPPALISCTDSHFIIDTGASLTVTNHKDDFLASPKP